MSIPTLHYHPLSSYCHKVLMAADALDVQLQLQQLDPSQPAERAALEAWWPTGKMPLLVDAGRPVPESSIIIEYLQQHHAPAGRALIPSDPEAALQVRLWDRLSDLYVMTPMQAFTVDRLRAATDRDPLSVSQAEQALAMAYAMFDRQLDGRTWLAGEPFSLADCAAAPALFYAQAYVPVPTQHAHLVSYLERLWDHPPVARTIDQARPWFKYFPGREGLARRFVEPEA